MSEQHLIQLSEDIRDLRKDIVALQLTLAEQRGARQMTGRFVAAVGSAAALVMTVLVDVAKGYLLRSAP